MLEVLGSIHFCIPEVRGLVVTRFSNIDNLLLHLVYQQQRSGALVSSLSNVDFSYPGYFLFDWVEALHPSQQFFSHVRTFS